MPYRTFDITEVARYLHLRREDVERLVKGHDIPFERQGGRLVFRKVQIDEWASPRILGLEGRRLTDYHHQSSQRTREHRKAEALVPEMLRPEWIEPALPAKTKASVLREMTALACKTGLVSDKTVLLDAIEAREDLLSTGLPGGLALLHPRVPETYLFDSSFIVMGRTVQEIPFGAPDGRGTDLFFLLACGDDRLHLHTLARICMMVQKTDLLTALRQSPDAASLFQSLVASEQEVLSALGNHR
jgi:nitrogen PTS system EIIA component